MSTSITCNAAALLDCEGDGVPDAECVISGDTIGVLPELLDGVIPCATNADCFAATGDSNATCNAGFCDFSNSNPNLNASFFIACVPPALGGLPGAVPECTAVTTGSPSQKIATKHSEPSAHAAPRQARIASQPCSSLPNASHTKARP